MGNALSMEEGVSKLERELIVLSAEKDAAFEQIKQLQADIDNLNRKANESVARLSAFHLIELCATNRGAYKNMSDTERIEEIRRLIAQVYQDIERQRVEHTPARII